MDNRRPPVPLRPTLQSVLASIADEAARRFGSRTVVHSPQGDLSYRELSSASVGLARELRAHGVGPGDIVALVLPSGADWLIAAVATNRIGAAYGGISPVLSPAERSELVRLVRPRLVLTTPDLADGLPLRTPVVAITPGDLAPGDRGDRGDARSQEQDHVVRPTREPLDSDPAVICFTSGTTGRPKAAMYTTDQLRAIQRIDLGRNAEEIWDGGSAMLASTQFAHVGMATKFPWYLRLGMTLCVMERWRAEEALQLVARHRMTTIGAIAPQLALMLRSPRLFDTDVSSVELVIAGGAASPPELVRKVRERFDAGYSIRYSSTESGGVGLATDPFTDDETEWATVGRPRPGVEIRIADRSDVEVPTGEIGELQLRSPATMQEYWNDPDATRAALSPDRWLRTGDLARLDDQGRVVLAGRRSDMYIRGGYNVFPAEVEAVLINHPDVDDIVIVPTPDDVMGEIGVALVVSRTRVDLEDLREFGSRDLARHKLPERIESIEQVPLTETHKIDRTAARSLLR